MSTVAVDVRKQFSALQVPTAFLDAPAGTQCPDAVIDAIAGYLRSSNSNVGGTFGHSRATDALIANARLAAASFLGCTPDETAFGPSMTNLNFALTRTVGRTLKAGDEIVVTRLDHEGNVAPWLELAHDIGLEMRFVELSEDTTLDLVDLQAKLSDRTRVVAFPLASNALGTLTDAKRIVELAHDAGALAWGDAVHYAPHRPLDVADLGVDVLLCSPYKFFGPHMGLAYVRADLTSSWRTYKVRPSDHPYENGTLQHELLSGFVAAVDYIDSVGWPTIQAHERALGERFLDGLPERCTLYGLPTMDGRVPTFAFRVDGLTPRGVAEKLGARDIAVWEGDYYAVEVMEALRLAPEGAVRAGFVHYNTVEEIDRLLTALEEI